MAKFKLFGEEIEANTFYHAYAIRFNCTVARAIADRDHPMTLPQCVKAYFQSTGSNPTPEQIKIMAPESDEYCREFESEQL